MKARREVKPAKGSSRPRTSSKPVSSVTKKVRMTEHEAERLAKLAAATGRSESEVLRGGILLTEKDGRRQKAWDALIKMAEEAGPEPPKPRWRSP